MNNDELVKLGEQMMAPLAIHEKEHGELTNNELSALYDIILELWPTE